MAYTIYSIGWNIRWYLYSGFNNWSFSSFINSFFGRKAQIK